MSMGTAQKFQFKYENFLWLEIHDIRQTQKAGDLAEALRLLLSLFDYLPDSIKNQFIEKRDKMLGDIKRLASVKASDFLMTHVWRNRYMEQYARQHFGALMNEVSTALSRLGYMERVGASPKRPSKGRMRVPE